MRARTTFRAAIVLPGLFAAMLALSGCGGSQQPQSTDEFLDSLPTGDGGAAGPMGSLPPISEPMENAGKIRLETDEYDMGTIPHDKLTHGEITVYNDGGMPVKMTRVDTTCACTQGRITPETAVVPPGGSSHIDVVVDPRRIPGFHSRKVLTVTSTDVNNPSVQVAVVANVDPEYAIDAKDSKVGDIPKGERFEKRIRFRTLIDEPIETVTFDYMARPAQGAVPPDTEATIEEVPESEWAEPGRRELDLVVTLLPNMPAGEFERAFMLEASIRGGSNRNQLTVSGTVVAPYQVSPAYPVPAARETDENGPVFHGRMTVSAATPVTLGNLEMVESDLEAKVVPGSSPNEVHVDMYFRGATAAPAGLFRGLYADITVGDKTCRELLGISLGGGVAAPHNH